MLIFTNIKMKKICRVSLILCCTVFLNMTNLYAEDFAYAFKHDVSVGDVILPNMLEQIDLDGIDDTIVPEAIRNKIRKNNLNHRYVKNKKTLIGKTVKKKVEAHVPLEKNFLKDTELVRKNATVDIVYNSDSIKIKAKGKAMENGSYQDEIKVKMSDTGNIIRGKVLIDGTIGIK
ncbi:flagellar basal body P-ring formation protein FlgA [Anaplasmataceae bacterium AB001_6]|nr:flagellar basal body P-ring formation protein FlgA [Anaplasmataceae bacterium AB001_6]